MEDIQQEVLARFLSDVWPDDAPSYCLAQKPPHQPRPRQIASPTREEAIAEAWRLCRSHADVYFAIAGYLPPEKTPNNNYRTNARAVGCKVLSADIDVKDDAYPSLKDAGAALLKACNEGLPKPSWMVRSGKGLHVYWTLNAPLAPDAWKPLAAGFHKLLLKYRIKHDAARTTGISSILRVPGSTHHKDPAKPLPVDVIGETGRQYDATALEEMIRAAVGDLPTFDQPRGPVNPALAAFTAGMVEDTPVPFEQIMAVCQQMRRVAEAKGNVPEPLWQAFLIHAAYAPDPQATALQYSTGHPEFDRDATVRKLDYILAQGYSPTRCATVELHNPGGCDGCPLRQDDSAPIAHARRAMGRRIEPAAPPEQALLPTAEGEVAAPLLAQHGVPEPYFLTRTGMVAKSVDVGGESADVIACPYPLVPKALVRDEHERTYVLRMEYSVRAGGETREVDIPMDVASEERGLSKFLSSEGIFNSDEYKRGTLQYVTYCARWMQSNAEEYFASASMGWTDDRVGFIVGDRLITRGHVSQHATSVAIEHVTENCVPNGTADRWYQAANVFALPGSEVHALSVLIGLGSPLFHLSGQKGVIYNLLGEGGVGKTTLLNFISSAWGRPDSEIAKLDDTVRAQQAIFGAYSSIPVTFDEITNIDEDAMSNLAYAITSGRTRHRLNRAGQLRRNDTSWDFVLCTTSNGSLLDLLGKDNAAGVAQQSRVFEVQLDRGTIPRDVMMASEHAINENYGHAGQEFMQYVLDNMGSIQRGFESVRNGLIKTHGVNGRSRFLVGLVAAALIAGVVMVRKLGKLNYDLDAIARIANQALSQQLSRMDAEANRDTVEVLMQFLRENASGIVEYNRMGDGRYFMPGGVNKTVGHIHGAQIANRIYISKASFHSWSKKRRQYTKQIIADLQARGIMLPGSSKAPLFASSQGDLYGSTEVYVVARDHTAVSGRPQLYEGTAKPTAEEETNGPALNLIRS